MNVGALEASPIGRLVPISGTDWRTGRTYRHFAYVPDPLPDAVALADATWEAVRSADEKLARLGHAARGPSRARRSVPSLCEAGALTAPALDWARGRPLTADLVHALQAALVAGARGDSGDAGRLRRGNVFLGCEAGRVEGSQFVPAPHGPHLGEAFTDWIAWLNRTESCLPPVVQAGLAHYQLETLHPYSDGNGRLGRLAITLTLVRRGVLRDPILAVSPWIHSHKHDYQNALLELSGSGEWDAWLALFAHAVASAADASRERLVAGRRLGRDPRPASVAAVAFAALAVAACGSGSSKTAGVKGHSEVLASPISTTGANPFTPAVGKDKAGVKPPAAAASTGGGPATYVASLPGLYGGTLDYKSCDAHKLVAFLEQNPSKAGAWASTLGISTSDIPHYVYGLTPVLLRTDTRVTNHGYVNGVADPIQSVLQAGTAVFVNTYGQPVVKCYCGNPLTPPQLLSAPVYTGPLWASFTQVNITIIQQSPRPISTYTLYDPNTGTEFKRTSGLHGKDVPVNQKPTPTGATGPTTPAPQTSTGGTSSTAPPTTPQPAENPSVSLSPNPVRQGDAVTLTGSGFKPGASVSIAVRRPDGGSNSFSTAAGSGGSISFTFPAAGNSPVGTYSVTATDQATGASASASIDVVAAGSNSGGNSSSGSQGTVT